MVSDPVVCGVVWFVIALEISVLVTCVLFLDPPTQPNLPLSCSEPDVELVLEKYSRKRPSLMVFGTVACSRDFMRSCVDLFKPIMVEKAKQVLCVCLWLYVNILCVHVAVCQHIMYVCHCIVCM